MNINAVMFNDKKDYVSYTTSAITLSDVFAKAYETSQYPIIIAYTADDLDTITRVFNLTKYLNDQYLLVLNDWDELKTALKRVEAEQIVDNYLVKTMFPDYTNTSSTVKIVSTIHSTSDKYLAIKSADNDNNFTIDYGSHNNPNVRNSKYMKWTLNDIIISQSETKLNFNNTIPIINGIVSYPIVSDGEMYVINGTRYIYNSIYTTQKPTAINAVLIDFSDFGDITHKYKLSECTKINISKDKNIKIEFDLPIDTETDIPIVSLFGRLFIPNIDNVNWRSLGSHTRISVSIPDKQLDSIIGSNYEKLKEGLHDIGIVKLPIDYMLEHLFDDKTAINSIVDLYGTQYTNFEGVNKAIIPYVVTISNKKRYNIVSRQYEPVAIYSTNKLIFDKNLVGGILINKYTKEIIDYTRIGFNDETLLCSYPYPNLFLLLHDENNKIHSICSRIFGICIDKFSEFDNYINVRDLKNYRLLDISLKDY